MRVKERVRKRAKDGSGHNVLCYKKNIYMTLADMCSVLHL